jgi:hypothetical protein
LYVVDSGNGSYCQQKWQSMAAAAMVLFVIGSCCQRRGRWDKGAMMQWHRQQWLLWLMVAVAMVAVVLNCPMVVDAAATIPSLASMAAAFMPSTPPPSTAASIGND